MIPLSLKLKGIYSYQDKEQTIDFVKLSSSGLFGIFGAVGSGKSTILEAISYVLYGETERLNSRDNRSYNMMNLKSDNLLIDFTFLNTPDKQKYRFIAKATRKKKRFEDVNAIERSALKLIDGEWVPIPLKSAEEISGLSYINFRRTVIIPQGRFQEFLQLGDTDRSKMMKELFHLEKFDLWGKAKFLEEKNDAVILDISGQLKQLIEITEDKITEILKVIEETKKSLDTEQKTAQELNSEIEKLKQLKTLFDKITLEQRTLDQLQIQKPSIEKLKLELQEFINCTAQFSEIIGKIREFNIRNTDLSNEIKKLNAQYQTVEQQLNKLEPIFTQIKLKYESREELKKLADDCRKLLETSAIGDEIGKLKIRSENGEKELQKNIERVSELEKSKNSLRAGIVKLKLNQVDLSELAKIKAWYTQLNALKNENSAIENEIQSIKNHEEECKKVFVLISDKIGFESYINKPETLLDKITQNIKQLEKNTEETENELKHLKIKQGLLSYSEKLVEGEACPVCGSTNHPEKMEPADLSENLDRFQKQLDILKLDVKKQLEIEKALNKKLTEYHILNERLVDNSKKLENSKQSIIVHAKSYQFAKQMDETSIEKAFIDAEINKKEIEKSEIEFSKIEKQLESEFRNKEKYQSVLNEINIAISSRSANYETLIKQINQNVFKEYSEVPVATLNEKIIQFEKDYQKIVTEFHSTEKQIMELKPQKDKLHGIIEAREKDLKQIIIDLDEFNQKLDKQIANSGYPSINEINLILEKSFDINSENKKISDFENQFYSANEQLTKLKQQTEGQTFEGEIFNQKFKAYEELSSQLNELREKLGSLKEEKAKLEYKIIEKQNLNKEFSSLTERAENIKALKLLFHSSGFVNFISSVYLQNLVNSANQRFQKLTRQKLKLELTSTNDFIIRDFLNEGKTRSVKTLSGGQTFQASLSLALALADSIQSINKSEDNFFFLDEGFGSLDKDSLATVFESLKSLRRENRIVGIISHVEELQQEIDNYLKIENTAEMGSVITASWE